MRVRNPVQVSKDRTFQIIFVILLLIVLCVIFYHGGTEVLRETRQEGPFLFVRLGDGHMYEASMCKNVLDRPSGNVLRFTAIGLDLSLFGKRMSAPVMIHCEFAGFWVDDYVLP